MLCAWARSHHCYYSLLLLCVSIKEFEIFIIIGTLWVPLSTRWVIFMKMHHLSVSHMHLPAVTVNWYYIPVWHLRRTVCFFYCAASCPDTAEIWHLWQQTVTTCISAAQYVCTWTTESRSCALCNMLYSVSVTETVVSLLSFSSSGDVIVYINDICVLGTTHADVVKLFQSVPIGQSVTLVLCRGYPLPFDPEDPSGAASTSLTPIGLEHRPLVVNGRSSYDPYLEYLSLSSQLPPQALAQASHPGDTHLDGSSLPPTTPGSASALTPHDDNVSMASSGTAGVSGGAAPGAELLTVTMVKGTEGFGFTIADSPTGQRVKQVMYNGLSVHLPSLVHLVDPEIKCVRTIWCFNCILLCGFHKVNVFFKV